MRAACRVLPRSSAAVIHRRDERRAGSRDRNGERLSRRRVHLPRRGPGGRDARAEPPALLRFVRCEHVLAAPAGTRSRNECTIPVTDAGCAMFAGRRSSRSARATRVTARVIPRRPRDGCSQVALWLASGGGSRDEPELLEHQVSVPFSNASRVVMVMGSSLRSVMSAGQHRGDGRPWRSGPRTLSETSAA